MWHRDHNTQLVEPGDTSFWKNCWRTDAFRALIEDPSTGYADFLAKVAQRPWWFITPKHAYERRHFAPWFAQAFIIRDYENKLIEDLYYWHDLIHAMTFVDASRMNEDAWRLAMRANEINTSLETEVIIYWRSPQLRAQTFDHAIWVDEVCGPFDADARSRLLRYRSNLFSAPNSLSSQHERALRAALPASLLPYAFSSNRDLPDFEALWALRRATTLSPREYNVLEKDLAHYEASADPFYSHWSKLWREVECNRAQFANLCAAGHWKEAVAQRYEQWERTANEDGVPYGALAKALA
jgi:hypothetical protein